jgi:hypothetical protein
MAKQRDIVLARDRVVVLRAFSVNRIPSPHVLDDIPEDKHHDHCAQEASFFLDFHLFGLALPSDSSMAHSNTPRPGKHARRSIDHPPIRHHSTFYPATIPNLPSTLAGSRC